MRKAGSFKRVLPIISALGAIFFAPAAPALAGDCANEAFRTGPAANLPDCRAYELVSSPEANGRLLWGLAGFGEETLFNLFPTELASPSRDSIAYVAYDGPLLNPAEPNGNYDLYEAIRTSAGWRTERRISPSGERAVFPRLGGVSSDHLYSFTWVDVIDGGSRPAGTLSGAFGTNYLDNPDGSFEPVGKGSLGEEPLTQGRYISSGGKHVIFSTGREEGQSIWCKTKQTKCQVLALEPNAAPTGTGTVYDREADGPTHVVSLLPGDVPQSAGQGAFYQGASKDGSAIAFKIEGNLYVRIHSGEAGAETELAAPASDNPVYAGLSEDGKHLFYVAGGEDGEIHRFDTATEADAAVNPGGEGELVNVSADGSHAYFVSTEALTGAQQNSQGDVAVPAAKGSGILAAAKGTGTLTASSTQVTGLTTSEGGFEAGMQISGSGIPQGTTIEAVGVATLTLSKPATESGARSLSAGSTLIAGVSTSEGGFLPGMAIEAPGIPADSEITAVGAGTLTISRAATEAGSRNLAATAPNLYGWSGGATTFLATVRASDRGRLANWTNVAVAPINTTESGPGANPSRATPDGTVLVFASRARLTPYDNAGHTEIYRFAYEDNSLTCASCEGAPEPGTGDARLQEVANVRAGNVIHNLSDDGSRVFFETEEALVAADTGGTNDIYEWQQDGGGSRIDLISSGRSEEIAPLFEAPNLPSPNLLFSVTPDGSDVVFLSQDDLTGQAGTGGVPAIYDARVGGGFAEPVPPRPCSEEECRGSAIGITPSSMREERSSSTQTSGNVKLRKRHCHSRKRSRKVRSGKRCQKNRVSRRIRRARLSRAIAESGSATPPATVAPTFLERGGGEPLRPAETPTMLGSGEFSEFGIDSLTAGLSNPSAGGHTDFSTFFSLKHHFTEGEAVSDARLQEARVTLPPGLLGNPNAIPRCETGEFLAFGNCPAEAQVGVARVLASQIGGIPATEPIYNMTPPHPDREIARLGFYAILYPVFIDVKVRTASDYGVTATVHNAPGLASLLESETTLWGNPSDVRHDPQRLTANEALACLSGTACKAPGGKREVPRTGLAFMTNPAACGQGNVGLAVTSYQLPGQLFSKEAPLPAITDCQGLPFAPSFTATPTTHTAGAPTGLKTTLTIPQHLGADEPATATMREARVTLPRGMGVNPAAANWIGTCTAEQVGYHEEADAHCPDGAKLGVATITSPALPEPIQASLYQRSPEPGRQLGLWLVADALGLHIKLPASLEPDNRTGRLTAVFSDLPPVPVEEIDLDVWGGDRAPLINPPTCATYNTDFSFAPHSSDPAATGTAPMTIDQGCGRPFDPKLRAGTTDPVAGHYSPFVFDLTREDSEAALRGFTLTLPDGLLAKLKGVERCTEAQATAAACPQGSAIGTLTASAGAGPEELWVPQPGRPQPRVYLGGPYEGSPFSVITEAPAQAGPFDLGTLVVRTGLALDPATGRALIEADPLPSFFEGAELSYRRIHVVVDRPGFTLNPTDCREMAIESTLTSQAGQSAHPAARFAVDGCKALKFKPRLALALKGPTKRGGHPALAATLRARPGDANIARAVVSLPHAEFLDQSHIGTICTRVQFAADRCPKRSVYGWAEALSPLLDKPLRGPVYLRSSDHPLPDLVAALRGEVEIDLAGRIDSHKGGIRTSFESVPDAPVTKFVLKMAGGKKGLLVNSTDVCRRRHRAGAEFSAQNGRVAHLAPALRFTGCGGKKG